MISGIWNPAVYHGRGKRGVFFEGWYFKLISASKDKRLAVIPGVFHHPDPDQEHAFIQVLDGISSQVHYHRFPFSQFNSSNKTFLIRVGESTFHYQGLELNISNQDQSITGDLAFDKLHPWPVKTFSPGVMGPFRFVPFMQTYHGILSLDHSIQGSLNVSGDQHDFTGGRGYIEKDWGRTFPRAYIWLQSNHFADAGISLSASVATIPWLQSWFRGFLIGFRVAGKLYRFTTYLGSTIDSLKVNDHSVIWITTGKKWSDPDGIYPGYRLTIQAERGEAGLLSAPELDGMTPRIFESLTAEVAVTLTGLDDQGEPAEVLFQGRGDCGGLEVAGSVEELVDPGQEP